MPTLTADWQVAVGDLVMGPDTVYELLDFNPWTKTNRVTQGDDRAWAHGSWSGREFIDEVVVPLRVCIRTETATDWLAAHQALAAAFAPSDTGTDATLQFRIAGQDFAMFGRPRMVEPEVDLIVAGKAFTKAAFVALDPRIYSAAEHEQQLGLASVTGGLTVSFTTPFTIAATVTAGRASITNAGTLDTSLTLRIDAFSNPLVQPRVTLVTPDAVQVLRCDLTLDAGQWLVLDTGAHTAYLNGEVSRRGNVSGDWPLLPGGPSGVTSELAFDAGGYTSDARLTATWRDAWT